jgi:tetratricopeptide (TPR) repeat protein
METGNRGSRLASSTERDEVNAIIVTRNVFTLGLTFALLFSSSQARSEEQAPQEQWIGRKFMPKANAKAMVGGKEMRRELHNVPLVATQVNGDWLWMGKAWVKKSDVVPLEKAEQYYTEYLRINPLSTWGYDMRGTLRKDLGQFDNAIRDFTQVIKYAPKEAWGYVARGSIREQRGEYSSALADFAEAMRLAPQSPIPYLCRAAVWGEKNDFDKAMADYAVAMRLDPQNSSLAHFNRGLLEQKWGDYESALNDYAEALRLDPENAGAMSCRARIRAACPDASLRDGKLALAEATKACVLSHYGVEAWIDTLAAAYAETGDFEQAVKWQQKAIAMLGISKGGLHKPEESKARLELYQAGQPYRETPKPKLPGKAR